MIRRTSPSRARSQGNQAVKKYNQAVRRYNQDVRRQEQARKQAINRLDREINKHNQEVRRQVQARRAAVNQIKQSVRSYNAKVKTDRQRIQNALTSLRNRPVVHRYTTLRTSVDSLDEAFDRLDQQTTEDQAEAHGRLLVDLPHRENANNLEVMDALLSESTNGRIDATALQSTKITNQLALISPELSDRWFGAVYALSPRNPDAARHFCTSVREIFTTILSLRAPDEEVFRALPDCPRTDLRKPTRRARIQFLLHRKGISVDKLEDFVEKDIGNIINLFDVLSGGTHGPAGKFGLHQLLAIKKRVEDGILFLANIVD